MPEAHLAPCRWYTGRTSLDVIRSGQAAWIGLASGDGLNRLHSDLLVALDGLFTELRHQGVGRVCLSDAGWMRAEGHHFSAGADLPEVGALTVATSDAFARRGQRVMDHLAWCGWRTLTVVSGAAMGGGCDLALHGQERWAVEGLKLAHPAARHGIITGFGGTVGLPAGLGEAGADRLFVGLERWGAPEALAAGAVHRVLASGEVSDAVAGWLQTPGYT
jgi:enoyl-CoA hydratase